MPTTLFGKRRVLSKMSASGMESGIVDECRLFSGDDFACVCFSFPVAAVLFRTFFEVDFFFNAKAQRVEDAKFLNCFLFLLFTFAFLPEILCVFASLRLCVKISPNLLIPLQSNQLHLNYHFSGFHYL